MDKDDLDDLLEAAAPRARTIAPSDLRAMMADAAGVAHSVTRRRRVKTGAATVAAFGLIIGGGGVAVASGLVSWPSGFEDPDGSYAFTLPSGRACEVRLIVEDRTSATEPSPDDETTRIVQASVADWLRDGALQHELDLDAADEEAARILAEQESYGMTVLIGADGWLTDAAIEPGRPDADDARAFAVNRAVGAAMTAHLVGAGFPESSWTFSTEGGVKCEAG